MQQNTWVSAFASARGLGHVRDNTPCQDSCAVQSLADGWMVAVVSDGAGSAPLSHLGSDFVARNAAQCLAQLLQDEQWTSLPTPQIWQQQAQKILQIVRQRLEQFAQNNSYNLRDLACTVVAALYHPQGALVAHIGDGRGTWRSADGRWQPLFTPFRGAEANQTVFITSDIWYADDLPEYLLTQVVAQPITALAICTDGCERGSFLVNVFDEDQQKYIDPNQPFAPFFEPNRKGLLQLHAEQKTQPQINEIWSQFLTDGHRQFKTEIDDKTLVLSVRLD